MNWLTLIFINENESKSIAMNGFDLLTSTNSKPNCCLTNLARPLATLLLWPEAGNPNFLQYSLASTYSDCSGSCWCSWWDLNFLLAFTKPGVLDFEKSGGFLKILSKFESACRISKSLWIFAPAQVAVGWGGHEDCKLLAYWNIEI